MVALFSVPLNTGRCNFRHAHTVPGHATCRQHDEAPLNRTFRSTGTGGEADEDGLVWLGGLGPIGRLCQDRAGVNYSGPGSLLFTAFQISGRRQHLAR
jgi:hypothetical protein